nr:immunoglobulin heavy chain junction region [Macaca mulatta]MOW46391.1 immunoglobulin heavy chain junction region [Macaca mulatta]MOW46459.1 immunoglobulin heavy chain junction region [Macaca mulatta]MOW46629.1 immunoglobulin heavy chain junction region [Macaca mulatta]MOW46786.1 immunoglobulin heavy chain junction region [Macaca mulatta]
CSRGPSVYDTGYDNYFGLDSW